ncbi:MAG TPA: MgtC/SapB family protein [Gemmatimonadaceae bacterium]|nr:MgtC/SapB family protein [Gemmatimonadaceae bacterium]
MAGTTPGLPGFFDLIGALKLELLLQLVLAVLLGGAIGLEREISGKPAGLRTNILICVGATLITHVSVAITVVPERLGDPSRLAAMVVSGIGFIGAGTIMQARGTVVGLTSAATIWVVAAIGIAIGASLYVEAVGTGALVTLVLAGLGSLEHRLRRARRVLSCTIRARVGFPPAELEAILGASGIRILGQRVFDHPEDRVFELKLSGPARQYDIVTEKLLINEGIFGVHID